MRNAFVLAMAAVSLLAGETRPKVRAITAFIRIDAKGYVSQLEAAAKFLNAAKAEYEASGYEVETLRMVAQPVAEYIRGMKHDEAVAFVRQYGELAVKLGARPNMGALMVGGGEDRFATDVAIDVFASTGINGSLI